MYTADDWAARWLDSDLPDQKGKWIHDALTESDEFGPMLRELETVIKPKTMTSWLSARPERIEGHLRLLPTGSVEGTQRGGGMSIQGSDHRAGRKNARHDGIMQAYHALEPLDCRFADCHLLLRHGDP